jgi:hypothetical protein
MLLTIAVHALSGWRVEVEQSALQGDAAPTFAAYVSSPHYLSSVFENWESEFLQMGLFVLLTVHLRQKGSSESRPMDPAEEPKEKFPKAVQPWPVRKGGLWLRLYEHSLSAALLLLFVLSFIGHWLWSWRLQVEEQLALGGTPHGLLQHLASAELWFESMQNWQSEFLAVIAIVVLSIFLREKDSSQSKPVEAPHSKTGA